MYCSNYCRPHNGNFMNNNFMEIICIKKKLINAIAKIFFKMDCFFLLIKIYIYIYIYIYIHFSFFFCRQKFHSISSHKPKNNHCLTKCYQFFSDRVKVYFFNTIYNLSTESIQISALPYNDEIFDNTKRFTLHPVLDEIAGKLIA